MTDSAPQTDPLNGQHVVVLDIARQGQRHVGCFTTGQFDRPLVSCSYHT